MDDQPDERGMPPDVFCPQCGYDLRGIPEIRCPECGFRYDRLSLKYLGIAWYGRCIRWLQTAALLQIFAIGLLSVFRLSDSYRSSMGWFQIPVQLAAAVLAWRYMASALGDEDTKQEAKGATSRLLWWGVFMLTGLCTLLLSERIPILWMTLPIPGAIAFFFAMREISRGRQGGFADDPGFSIHLRPRVQLNIILMLASGVALVLTHLSPR